MTSPDGPDGPSADDLARHRYRMRLAIALMVLSTGAALIALINGQSAVLTALEFVLAACVTEFTAASVIPACRG